MTPSITVATYPEFREDLYDPSAEAEYELLVGASKGLRSLTSEYAIKENANTFIQALDSATHSVLTSSTSLPSIKALAGKTVSEVTILSPSDPAPTGCAVYTVGASATVFLDIKGRVDIDKEITKAKDRLKKADEAVQKQKKILGMEDFETKVSEAVKEMEREKLKAAETECRNWEMSINQFERLRLE